MWSPNFAASWPWRLCEDGPSDVWVYQVFTCFSYCGFVWGSRECHSASAVLPHGAYLHTRFLAVDLGVGGVTLQVSFGPTHKYCRVRAGFPRPRNRSRPDGGQYPLTQPLRQSLVSLCKCASPTHSGYAFRVIACGSINTADHTSLGSRERHSASFVRPHGIYSHPISGLGSRGRHYASVVRPHAHVILHEYQPIPI